VQLDPQTETALGHAARKIFAAHSDDLNFTGCAVGFRRRAGEMTDEPAAVAMVVDKRPEAIVSQRRLLPKTVEVEGRSWGVDVVEVGPLNLSDATLASAGSAVISGTFRPPLQGCSISNFNGTDATGAITGTLGCLVRDQTDQTVCMLSSSHVLTRTAQGGNGELIIQPGADDGGTQSYGAGALKRSVTLTTGTNTADAAIAQLTDQAHISQNVVNGLMAPISATHPAVGMVVADDSATCGKNCFLFPLAPALQQLNVTLLAATSSSSAVVAPTVGMHIEKVGRTTAYTSSTVAATGAIVKANWQPLGQITLSGLIWTQAFHLPGDSGAVACQGGNGHTFAPIPDHCKTGNCGLLDALATYYQIPVNSADNNALADKLRDTFMSQSMTGQLIIGTTYLNAQMIINRLASETGAAHQQSQAQAKAKSLYSKYHALAAQLISSASPTAVVSSGDLNTAASILHGLTGQPPYGTGMTTSVESTAAWVLYSNVLKPTLGMNRQQLIDYMNTSAVFQQVFATVQSVPTLTATGSVV
jgi:hypothetical protein